MPSAGGPAGEQNDRIDPDPGRIVDRSDFAVELSLAREKAGKTVRALAKEVDQPAATIGGYLSGQHLPPVRQTELFRKILACLGITDAGEVAQWLEALARVRRKPGPRPASAGTPYRGLESFRTEDSEWFFGRESLLGSLVAKLADLVGDPARGSMVVVVGPSGSGKSSLLRAGLIPAITGGALPSGPRWRCVLLAPGREPVRALSEQLAAATGAEPAEIEAGLRSDTFSWAPSTTEGAGLVVIVDQFEEAFTLCGDELERQAFIAALRRVSRVEMSAQQPVPVVLGLRADFYGRAAREPALVPALQDHQVLVGPMSAEQLRRAITEPARLAGCEVDPDLVDLLISEFVPRGSPSGLHDPGALPLLSHALLETFRRARRGRLSVADYLETGGITGSVRQTAERAYAELSEEEQALARRVFLRLVKVDEAVVTRRRVSRVELPASGSLERVVDRFVAHRLLTAHENTVEVSHEALLSAWPRLREWIDADQAGSRVRRQLTQAAREWADGDRDPSGLLRGGRLESARAWSAAPDHEQDLNELERSFLAASEGEDRRERRDARRRTHRLQVLLGIAVSLAVTAAALAMVAVRARNTATHARDLALSRQVAIEANRLRPSDPALAAQLALAAYRISATPDARSALLDSSAVPTPTRLLGQSGATALSVTADGGTMAVSRSIDGTIQLYSLSEKGRPVRRGVLPSAGADFQPFAVAFSPDGYTVAAGGTDDAVRLWDVKDVARPRLLGPELRGFTGAVQSLVFSRDGHTMAAAGTAAGVLRWDVTSPANPVVLAPLTGMAGATQTVAFSADGTRVAAGGTDSTTRLWDTTGAAPVLLAQLPNPTATTVDSVAFSPDGRLLAAGSKGRSIQRWDLSATGGPAEVGPALTGFGSWVNSVAFSPDGRTLAAGSSDNTIRFWAVDGWKPRTVVLTSPGPVTGIEFLQGGDHLVSVAADGVARLWSLPGPVIEGPADTVWSLAYSSDGRRLQVAPGRGDRAIELWDASDSRQPQRLGDAVFPDGIGVPTGSGAISPNGRLLAGGTADGHIQLWDLTDTAKPAPLGTALAESSKLVEQTTFSPNGHLLAAGGDDNSIVIWDVTDPAHPASLTRLTEPTSLVLAVAFSPDSQLFAAASADKSVRLWDLAAPERPVAIGGLARFDNYAYGVAFSPDGHLLAASSADKTLRLWDITDRRHPRELGPPVTGPGNYVYSVAFDPHGHTLAAAVTDGTVWQWDITNPARPQLLATLTALPGAAFVVAYSPDGRTLAAAGDGKTVHLWNTDPEAVARSICASSGDGITRAEWVENLPNRPFRPPCR
ncbi:MAG: hypothetical protein QOE07_2167 [Acidimicrobiaceae bacterium]|jgi:WD40 repeat protein/energy-coupling factor transporter ATP-binding protein EcfA2|nr:hypothetical protein [Acidimicrobiaceae bacterium]